MRHQIQVSEFYRLKIATRWINRRVVVALVATAALTLAGCGSGNNGSTSSTNSSGSAPAFTADRTNEIAYVSNRALNGSDAPGMESCQGSPGINLVCGVVSNIWVMHADGSNQTPVTQLTAEGSDCGFAVWSPDGSKIAFLSSRALDGSNAQNAPAASNMWVMNADGSNARPLTKYLFFVGGGHTLSPEDFAFGSALWSPDGRKIAYAFSGALDGSNQPNSTLADNVWLMNADGSNAMPLTMLTGSSSIGLSAGPYMWSPDGSRILYGSNRALDGSDAANNNNDNNIWVMNSDGSASTPLTRYTSAEVSGAAWSPDESKILYSSSGALDGSNTPNAGFKSNVWVMNADGSSPTPLTHFTKVSITGFSWSHDGNRVIFACPCALDGSDATNPTANIWVMNADGSGRTPLTRYTNSLVQILGATLSVDGAKIFFESNGDLSGVDTPIGGSVPAAENVWVMNADGSGMRPLTVLVNSGVNGGSPRVP